MPKVLVPFTYTITAVPKGKRKEREQMVVDTVEVDLSEKAFNDLPLVMTTSGLEFRGLGSGTLCQPDKENGITEGNWSRMLDAWRLLRGSNAPLHHIWSFCGTSKDIIHQDDLSVLYGDIRVSDRDAAEAHVVENAGNELIAIAGKIYRSQDYVWPTRNRNGTFEVSRPVPVNYVTRETMAFRLDRHDAAVDFVGRLVSGANIGFDDVQYTGESCGIFDEDARLLETCRAVIGDLQGYSPLSKEVLRQDVAFFADYVELRDSRDDSLDDIRTAMEAFTGSLEALPANSLLRKELPLYRALLAVQPASDYDLKAAPAP